MSDEENFYGREEILSDEDRLPLKMMVKKEKRMTGKYHYIGTFCHVECSMFLFKYHGPRFQIKCPQKYLWADCILVYRKEAK